MPEKNESPAPEPAPASGAAVVEQPAPVQAKPEHNPSTCPYCTHPTEAVYALFVASWTRMFSRATESIGKISVGAAALLYLCGFVISNLHYARIGVPTSQLPHVTFLSAGCLFIVFTAVPGYLGVACASGPTLRSRFAAGAITAISIVTIAFLCAKLLMPMIYLSEMAILGYVFGRADLRDHKKALRPASNNQAEAPSTRHYEGEAIWRAAGPIAGVAMCFFFGLSVFPHVPRYFGGASPVQVIIHWRDLPAGIPANASLYQEFETERTLYLALREECNAFLANPAGICPIKHFAVPRDSAIEIQSLESILPDMRDRKADAGVSDADAGTPPSAPVEAPAVASTPELKIDGGVAVESP